jgi:hypothetical protein
VKKFITQLLIFSIPFIIILAIPTFILGYSREDFYKIDHLLKKNEKYLIGYAYHENNYGYLKWEYLKINEKRTIWALGSSRVLQFRENMFDSTFYNAGYTIVSINDFRPFLKSLPDNKLPDFIILGLDQWMFNVEWDNLNSIPSIDKWQNDFIYIPKLVPTYQTVYKDLFAGKITFSLLRRNYDLKKIGLNAIFNDKGFRNDGSMYYGNQIIKLINKDTTAYDYHYSNTLERIKYGVLRFQYCKTINEKALVELNELLKFCKERNIKIVAFLPPFADKVYKAMLECNKYGYLNELYGKLKPIFDSYSYEIYDFTDVSSCKSSDNEMIDGIHGGDLTYQKILLTMLDYGSTLRQITNVQRLENDLVKRVNNYIVYPN